MAGENLELSREDALRRLENEFGFSGSDFYLLELIPLIEVIWADGVKQEEEMKLLFEFVIKHADRLQKQADGVLVVSEQDIRQFIHRFTRERPSPDLLRTLRMLAHPVIFGNSDVAINQQKSRDIGNYCMDIAAACVTRSPSGHEERIMSFEKELVTEIITQFCNK